jgi:hypothetical protein
MKGLLLLIASFLFISTTALADHIGLYSDQTGTSCSLAPGFNTTAAVIHKNTAGATGSRFKIVFPAGTSAVAFSTPYVFVGNLTSDLSLAYGQCLSSTIVLGTITAMLGSGSGSVRTADGHPFILYTNCSFAEAEATGGGFGVGTTSNCEGLGSQSSTWSEVKALYR